MGRKALVTMGAKDMTATPSSPILHLTNQAINAFGAKYKRRKGENPIRTNKNTQIGYIEKPLPKKENSWSIVSENTSNKLTITIDDIQLLKSNNKGLKKCFTFFLQKCNEQNYTENVGFSLRELVDNGMYSCTDSARKGVKDSLERIMSLTFKGTSKKGKRTIIEQGGKLIYHYKIENGYVTISFNQNFNVEFIAQYFTFIPNWAYQLSNRAFSLMEYIAFLARQHTEDIREKHSFNIGLRAVSDYLNLPLEPTASKHKQYIIDPIESAIEEIEKINNNPDFTITPVYNPNYKSINEYLDGYLHIEFHGEYEHIYSAIAEKTEKQKEAAAKRKEKALTMIEAKKIESKK